MQCMLHKRTRDLNAICKSYVDFIAKQTKACTNLRKLVGTCMQFRRVFGPKNKARKDSKGTKDICKDLCVIWTKFWAKQQNQNKIQGLTTWHERTHMQNLKTCWTKCKARKTKPRVRGKHGEGPKCNIQNLLDQNARLKKETKPSVKQKEGPFCK